MNKTIRRLFLALCALLFVIVTPAGASGAADNTFLIRDVRIFDGVRVTGTGSVLVVDGRIIGVGQVNAPAGIRVYDGRGKTVLPGLIDGHRHTVAESDPAADGRDALRFGVTTGLDMFGDPALIADAKRQRQSLARTDRQDVWSAGIGVTVPDGIPPDDVLGWPFPRLTSDADPDQFVADRIREGSDYVKLLIDDGSTFGWPVPTLAPAQATAVIDAAHRRNKQAVVHVVELEHAKTAVAAGVDGIVHMVQDAVDDTFISDVRARRTFVTPTLATVDCGQGGDDLLADPLVRPYLSDAQVRALSIRMPDCRPATYQLALQNVGRLHAAGVPVVAGTDAGAPIVAHGASMLAELADLVRAGLTPAQALSSATAGPAREYGLGDRGRVRSGFRADLLLVNGDPTRDIDVLRDMAVIWKNGYAVDRTVQSST